MKSYSKPKIILTKERYENIQLASGDKPDEECPGGYTSVCDAIKTDLGYQCSKHTFHYFKDDCEYYKWGQCSYFKKQN